MDTRRNQNKRLTTETTPDQTGVNNGILAGADHIQPLSMANHGNAMKFNGENAIYVPIKFVVGFPPMDEPMYVPISTNLDIQEYFTIDAWINVPGYTNATYNNIVVKCNHPDQACCMAKHHPSPRLSTASRHTRERRRIR